MQVREQCAALKDITIALGSVVVAEEHASDLATAFWQAHRLERLAAAESEGADRFDGVGDVDRLEGRAVRQEAAVDRRRVVRDSDALEGGGCESPCCRIVCIGGGQPTWDGDALEGGAPAENAAAIAISCFCADLATAFGQAHRLERLAAAESEGADRFDGVGDVN